jgi:hypothetical protein
MVPSGSGDADPDGCGGRERAAEAADSGVSADGHDRFRGEDFNALHSLALSECDAAKPSQATGSYQVRTQPS